MANSGGIITAPIVMPTDIAAATGMPGTSLADSCTSVAVNKWSKYKPVKWRQIDTRVDPDSGVSVLDSYLRWKSNARWWKDTYGKCGIDFVTYNGIQAAKNAVDNDDYVWNRLAPTGGASEPFRLIDFNEYNHGALPPTTDIISSNALVKAGGKMVVQIIRTPYTGDNITFAEMPALANYYFTAAIFDTSGNFMFAWSGPKTVSNYDPAEDMGFEIPYASAEGGYGNLLTIGDTYKIYGFLSTKQYTGSPSDMSGTCIPLPDGNTRYGLKPTSFKAIDDTKVVWINAWVNAGGDRIVKWIIRMYGNGQPTATIKLITTGGSDVPNQSHSIDFANATAISDPDLGNGWELHNNAFNTMLIPSGGNPEDYRVEFICTPFDEIVGIGYEIQP